MLVLVQSGVREKPPKKKKMCYIMLFDREVFSNFKIEDMAVDLAARFHLFVGAKMACSFEGRARR